MSSVYVAGPVVHRERPRRHRLLDSLLRLPVTSKSILSAYETVLITARGRGVETLLPRWDRELDAFMPDRFNDAIRRRIRSADAVITFLFADDLSAAVEAAMAALAEKPQLI